MATFVEAGLTGRIIGSAIEVHKGVGPGLLESAYRECLISQLRQDGMAVEKEKTLPVTYRGVRVGGAYRLDLVVEKSVLIELKSVDQILPIHRAQTLTYLKLSGLKVGLLLNFNTVRLKDGIERFVM